MNKKEQLRSECISTLKGRIKAGQTIYTTLQNVSSNGMSRRIIVTTIDDGRIWNITRLVATACEYRYNDNYGALVVGGCGMDMGFSVVYGLSSVLFRGDFHCVGEGCPSNDHANDRDGSWSRETNKGRLHSDGGYALRHSWI